MKPKNFPARKLLRRFKASPDHDLNLPFCKAELEAARKIRTKKVGKRSSS